MTTCTFDGATVPTSQITNITQIGTYYFEVTVHCKTPTYSDYTTLAGKAGTTMSPGICANPTTLENGKCSVQSYGGTVASLVLNGTTYTYCYIMRISAAETPNSKLGLWEFDITFVRDTAT